MKRFLNDKSQLVQEAIDGLVRSSGGRLVRLDGYPHTKVVVRADWDRSKVAVLSGGGAGHEPAHAGFVGCGMLTGAISGEVFASPSVSAVLAAILEVTGDAGCLLVVKNYTGDRLNFGLAAERAKTMGKKVTMVIVGDDVALPDSPQPRGIAGTLFVHKIAGHHAEAGASLEDVTAAAQSAADATRSLGLSLSTCTLPGNEKDDPLGPDEVELGLGIHGEPGVEKIAMAPVRDLVRRVVERLPAEGPVAALVNNLGAVPPMEMAAITNELLQSAIGDNVELLIGPAPLMTSLEMNGFSISVLPLDDARRAALRSSVEPPAWPSVETVAAIETRALADTSTHATPSSDPAVRGVVEKVLAALVAAESDLDALDNKIGDGDAGSTLAGAAKLVESKLDAMPFADPRALLATLSETLTDHVGGSSGVLLAILLAAAAESWNGSWSKALAHGVEELEHYGGAKRGDRTMVDALEPALEALPTSLAAAATAARAGADATATMTTARAGRAAYARADVLEGVVDPGAEAVARVFEALGGGG